MELLFNTDNLRKNASEIEQYAEELDQNINTTNTQIDNLITQWEGQSKGSFITSNENLRVKLKSYLQCVLDVSDQLRSVSNSIETEDKNMASSIKK